MSKTREYSYPSKGKDFTKFTALMVFEANGCLPNGDPSGMNRPRLLGDRGFITPMSIKRKLRDLVAMRHPVVEHLIEDMDLDADDFEIAMKKLDGDMTVSDVAKALTAGREKGKITHWDARIFGGLFLEDKGKSNGNGETKEGETKEKKAAKPSTEKLARFKETGAVVFGPGISVNPIEISTHQITRTMGMSVSDKTGEMKGQAMGDMAVVNYGIYTMPIYFNPCKDIIEATMMHTWDIEFLRRLLPKVCDLRSATRHNFNLLHLYWYEHSRSYGDVADWKLIEAMSPKLKDGADGSSKGDFMFFGKEDSRVKELLGEHAADVHDFAD